MLLCAEVRFTTPREGRSPGKGFDLNIDAVCLYIKIEAHFTVTFPGCPRCATAASRDDIIPAVGAGNIERNLWNENCQPPSVGRC